MTGGGWCRGEKTTLVAYGRTAAVIGWEISRQRTRLEKGFCNHGARLIWQQNVQSPRTICLPTYITVTSLPRSVTLANVFGWPKQNLKARLTTVIDSLCLLWDRWITTAAIVCYSKHWWEIHAKEEGCSHSVVWSYKSRWKRDFLLWCPQMWEITTEPEPAALQTIRPLLLSFTPIEWNTHRLPFHNDFMQGTNAFCEAL